MVAKRSIENAITTGNQHSLEVFKSAFEEFKSKKAKQKRKKVNKSKQ
jgi:hypothetical protein